VSADVVTIHRLERRLPGADAHTRPTISDREICHDARARRGHPSETPLAGKRRRTHPDTSPGGTGKEDSRTEERK